MERSERAKVKQLANDAIIDCYGLDTREARLAQALESAIDELEFVADECDHCKTCETHGDHENTDIEVDVDEVLGVHKALTGNLESLKKFHVELATMLTDVDGDETVAETLATEIESLESNVDDLEAAVIP